jgi:hypothetical protein
MTVIDDEITELKRTALNLIGWLRKNTRHPEDAVSVLMIVSAIFEKINRVDMGAVAERASEELAGTEAAGSAAAMLRSYRATQRMIYGEVIMRLLRETAN